MRFVADIDGILFSEALLAEGAVVFCPRGVADAAPSLRLGMRPCRRNF
jgi:hypothetical protein